MDLNLERKYVKANIFDGPADGFVIMDTLNNPKFPIDSVILDKTRFDSTTILKEYRKIYRLSKSEIFMPWHFQVELVDRDYVIQNTRPVNYKTPFKEYQDRIIICLVGNSSEDVYMPDIYKKIANICIKPFYNGRVEKVPIDNMVFLTGKAFFKQMLFKHL